MVGREFVITPKQIRNPATVPPNRALRIKRCSQVWQENGWSDHVPPRVVPLIAYLAAADPPRVPFVPPRANSPRETETDSASIRSLLQDTVGNISSRWGNNTGRTTMRQQNPPCQLGRNGPAGRFMACCPAGRLVQETREPGKG